jgi:hypothetical protein
MWTTGRTIGIAWSAAQGSWLRVISQVFVGFLEAACEWREPFRGQALLPQVRVIQMGMGS